MQILRALLGAVLVVGCSNHGAPHEHDYSSKKVFADGFIRKVCIFCNAVFYNGAAGTAVGYDKDVNLKFCLRFHTYEECQEKMVELDNKEWPK